MEVKIETERVAKESKRHDIGLSGTKSLRRKVFEEGWYENNF